MSIETNKIEPIYPSENKFHPRFEHLLSPPFTHLHPYDVLKSIFGESEIVGQEDNQLIAHFHEHSGNLGKHLDKNKFSDEVPYCSSALNWAADMSGCRKTNSAIAASWGDYGNPRESDIIEVGDIVLIERKKIMTHVTLCDQKFNRKTDQIFHGYGANQGNMIKTSTFLVSHIKSIQMWDALPGTVLAPIGILKGKNILTFI